MAFQKIDIQTHWEAVPEHLLLRGPAIHLIGYKSDSPHWATTAILPIGVIDTAAQKNCYQKGLPLPDSEGRSE